MANTLKRNTGNTITASDDRALNYRLLTDGLTNEPSFSYGGLTINVPSLTGMLAGSEFYTDAVDLMVTANTSGCVYVEINLASSTPLSVGVMEGTSVTYEDINGGGNICQMIVATYTAGTAITDVTASYTVSRPRGTQSVTKSITLTAASWSSGSYTISDSRITATSNQEVIPAVGITSDQYTALCAAQLVDGGQAAGSLTLTALGTVPTIDIPIRVIYRGEK